MKTTIRIDNQLLAERPPVKLTTVSGNGPRPGVDLDDSAELLDLMDKFNASS